MAVPGLLGGAVDDGAGVMDTFAPLPTPLYRDPAIVVEEQHRVRAPQRRVRSCWTCVHVQPAALHGRFCRRGNEPAACGACACWEEG